MPENFKIHSKKHFSFLFVVLLLQDDAAHSGKLVEVTVLLLA